ncbi:hypothetical protein BU16DRAFT_563415 [Lophium mytilinum]|uniref:Cupin 2 conserved barrel domain-containing protein n=1 Tax=Lophium mytilinum TaxID=390894 RepID=A0A6A6QNB9_9PEZI|nr:hypothetical protein BU16DRAFT_563415 [Lophium mytilinum]
MSTRESSLSTLSRPKPTTELSTAAPTALPQMRRYVTAQDPLSGRVRFSSFPETNPTSTFATPITEPSDSALIAFSHIFISINGKPVSTNNPGNVGIRSGYVEEASALVKAGCTVLSHIDIPPRSGWKVKRKVCLDYGVVLEGEVRLLLYSSREERVLKKGDVVVQQQAAQHWWVNESRTEWVRLLFLLRPGPPLKDTVGED